MRCPRDQGKSQMEAKTGTLSMTRWHLKMFKKEASEGRIWDELSQTIQRVSSQQRPGKAGPGQCGNRDGPRPQSRVPVRLLIEKQGRQRREKARAESLSISFPYLAPGGMGEDVCHVNRIASWMCVYV